MPRLVIILQEIIWIQGAPSYNKSSSIMFSWWILWTFIMLLHQLMEDFYPNIIASSIEGIIISIKNFHSINLFYTYISFMIIIVVVLIPTSSLVEGTCYTTQHHCSLLLCICRLKGSRFRQRIHKYGAENQTKVKKKISSKKRRKRVPSVIVPIFWPKNWPKDSLGALEFSWIPNLCTWTTLRTIKCIHVVQPFWA